MRAIRSSRCWHRAWCWTAVYALLAAVLLLSCGVSGMLWGLTPRPVGLATDYTVLCAVNDTLVVSVNPTNTAYNNGPSSLALLDTRSWTWTGVPGFDPAGTKPVTSAGANPYGAVVLCVSAGSASAVSDGTGFGARPLSNTSSAAILVIADSTFASQPALVLDLDTWRWTDVSAYMPAAASVSDVYAWLWTTAPDRLCRVAPSPAPNPQQYYSLWCFPAGATDLSTAPMAPVGGRAVNSSAVGLDAQFAGALSAWGTFTRAGGGAFVTVFVDDMLLLISRTPPNAAPGVIVPPPFGWLSVSISTGVWTNVTNSIGYGSQPNALPVTNRNSAGIGGVTAYALRRGSAYSGRVLFWDDYLYVTEPPNERASFVYVLDLYTRTWQTPIAISAHDTKPFMPWAVMMASGGCGDTDFFVYPALQIQVNLNFPAPGAQVYVASVPALLSATDQQLVVNAVPAAAYGAPVSPTNTMAYGGAVTRVNDTHALVHGGSTQTGSCCTFAPESYTRFVELRTLHVTALTAAASASPSLMWHSAVTYGTRVVVFGGNTVTWNSQVRAYATDPTSHVLYTLDLAAPGAQWQADPQPVPAAYARTRHTAVVVLNARIRNAQVPVSTVTTDVMLVLGGECYGNGSISTCSCPERPTLRVVDGNSVCYAAAQFVVYDLVARTWLPLLPYEPAPAAEGGTLWMPYQLVPVRATVVDTRVYVLGFDASVVASGTGNPQYGLLTMYVIDTAPELSANANASAPWTCARPTTTGPAPTFSPVTDELAVISVGVSTLVVVPTTHSQCSTGGNSGTGVYVLNVITWRWARVDPTFPDGAPTQTLTALNIVFNGMQVLGVVGSRVVVVSSCSYQGGEDVVTRLYTGLPVATIDPTLAPGPAARDCTVDDSHACASFGLPYWMRSTSPGRLPFSAGAVLDANALVATVAVGNYMFEPLRGDITEQLPALIAPAVVRARARKPWEVSTLPNCPVPGCAPVTIRCLPASTTTSPLGCVRINTGLVATNAPVMLGGLRIVGSGSGVNASSGVSVVQSQAVIDHCNITGHRTTGLGAGVSVQQNSVVALRDCDVSNNIAMGGGALYVDQSTVTVTRSRFAQNTAVQQQHSSSAVVAAMLTANRLPHAGCGGAVLTQSSTFTANAWKCDGNRADVAGGCMWSFYTTLSGTGMVWAQNTARGNGGGAFVWGLSSVALTALHATGNSALNTAPASSAAAAFLGGHGGALYLVQSDMSIASSAFTANTAAGNGGALVLDTSGGIVMSADAASLVQFDGNSAPYGGGGAVFWSPVPADDGSGAANPIASWNASGLIANTNTALYGAGAASATYSAALVSAPTTALTPAQVLGPGALVLHAVDFYGQHVKSENSVTVAVGPPAALSGATLVAAAAGVFSFAQAVVTATPGTNTTRLTFASAQLPHAFNTTVPLRVSACAPGYGVSADGQRCDACAEGKYSDAYGMNCTSCARGQCKGNAGPGVCDLCPDGQFASTTGQTGCTLCTTFSIPSRTGCALCPAGQYGDPNAHVCKPCGPGYYQSNTSALAGQPFCLACAAGTYTNDIGATGCDACGVGTAVSATGQTACAPCPSGSFAFGTGATGCLSCSSGYTVTPTLAGGGDCMACGDGLNCFGGVAQSLPGYWLPPESERAAVSSGDSIEALPCSIAMCVGNNGCGSGRADPSTNTLCGACLPDHSAWGDVCVECTHTNGALVFALVVASLASVLLFHVLSANQSDASFRQLMYLIATSRFLLTSAQTWLSWLGLFDFSSQSTFGSVCLFPITPSLKVFLNLFMPIIFIALLPLLALCHMLLNRPVVSGACTRTCGKALPDFERVAYVRTFVMAFIAAYTAVATQVFAYLRCESVPTADGSTASVMFEEPTIRCDSGTYHALSGVLYVLLVLIVFGVPLSLVVLLVRAQRQHACADLYWTQRFGWLTASYRARHFYWEIVALLRRALYASLSLAFGLARGTPPVYAYESYAVLSSALLLLQVLVVPYRSAGDNARETASLFALSVISALAVVRRGDGTLPPLSQAGVSVFVCIPVLLFVVHKYRTTAFRKWFVRCGCDRCCGSCCDENSSDNKAVASPADPFEPPSPQLHPPPRAVVDTTVGAINGSGGGGSDAGPDYIALIERTPNAST